MKKSLLLVAFAAAASVCMAAVTPVLEWAKMLTAATAKQTTISRICDAPEGSYYVAANFQTPTSLSLGSDEFNLPAITSNYQQNMCIMRMNADGSRAWTLIPSFSNISSNNSFIATADNGDLIYVGLFTFNKDGANAPQLLKMNDVAFNNIEVNWEGTPEAKSPYAAIMMRINLDGVVKWSKLIIPENNDYQVLVPSSPMEAKGLVCLDGNIYISGKVMGSVAVDGKDVIEKTFNSAAPQAFIIKFDGEGNALKGIVAEGDPSSQFDCLSSDGTYLYAAGNATGAGSLSIGGKSTTTYKPSATNVSNNIVVAKLDQDLNAEVLNTIEPSVNAQDKHVAQVENIKSIDGKLYVYGSVNGGFKNSQGQNIVQSSAAALAGFIISLDPTTLAAVSGVIQSTTISKYLNVLASSDGSKLYVYGYQMTNGGFYLREVAVSGLELTGGDTQYISTGGMQSLGTCHFNNETKQFILITRNNAATTIAGTALDKPAAFSGIIASLKINDLDAISSVEVPALDNENLNAPVEYFNMQGICVLNPTAGALYIKRQGSSVTKILVK